MEKGEFAGNLQLIFYLVNQVHMIYNVYVHLFMFIDIFVLFMKLRRVLCGNKFSDIRIFTPICRIAMYKHALAIKVFLNR